MSTEINITAEVHFAQQLASNQKNIRERAFKKLRRWFENNSSSDKTITKDGLLTIWKGLFYYFWHCDKMLVQEDVALIMSKLIHCFKKEKYAFAFIDTFYQTMAREWFSIDRFRLEKFMMLVRKFVNETFVFLQKRNWDLKYIKGFRKILRLTVFTSDATKKALGLQLHIVNIYMEELAKVGAEELTPKQTRAFLVPFSHILTTCENRALLNTISKDIFLYLIYQDADEEEFHEFPMLKFDALSVENLLIKQANKQPMKKQNVQFFDIIIKKFQDFQEAT